MRKLAFAALAVAVVAGGYFGARYATERIGATVATTTTTTTTTTVPVTVPPTTLAPPPTTAYVPPTTPPLLTQPTVNAEAQYEADLNQCVSLEWDNIYATAYSTFEQTLGRAPTQVEVDQLTNQYCASHLQAAGIYP